MLLHPIRSYRVDFNKRALMVDSSLCDLPQKQNFGIESLFPTVFTDATTSQETKTLFFEEGSAVKRSILDFKAREQH